MTKQFKIGERAVGGIIKINTEKKNNLHNITISALDWYNKRELYSATFQLKDERQIDNYLNELTTSYYADKIINYIKNKK
jgi:hypothetical protein